MYLDGMNIEHLLDLKKAHLDHLKVLQVQEAKQGLACPPHIITQIQDYTEKIQNIDLQIRSAQPGGSDTGPRIIVKPDVLDKLVTDQLKHQIIDKLEFTAYDITLALRRANSNSEIRHQEVRRLVHLQLGLIVAIGIYTRKKVKYGNNPATRYVPMSKGM